MDNLTFTNLRQLQTFIFVHEGEAVTAYMMERGQGAYIFIKLNQEHYVSCRWPFPKQKEEDEEQTTMLVNSIKKKQLEARVFPVNTGITQKDLHLALVEAGLGHLLINRDQ